MLIEHRIQLLEDKLDSFVSVVQLLLEEELLPDRVNEVMEEFVYNLSIMDEDAAE